MKAFLRRHPVATPVTVAILLAIAGVALAPWWIDLGPVRAKIERAASSALAGSLSYELMDLSWFPRPEVVVRGLKVSVPGHAGGTARTVRVSPSLLPLLRGRVVITKVGVEGLDLAVDLSSSASKEQPEPPSGSDWTQALRSLGDQTLDVGVSGSRIVLSRPGHRSLTVDGLRVEGSIRSAEGRAALTLSRLSADSPRLLVEGSVRADASAPSLEAAAKGSALDVTDVRAKLLSFAGDDAVIAAIFAILRGGTLTSFSFTSSGKAPADLGVLERMSIRAAVQDAKVRIEGPGLELADVTADAALEGGVLRAENAAARVGKSRASDGSVMIGLSKADRRLRVDAQVKADLAEAPAILARAIPSASFRQELALVENLAGGATGRLTIEDRAGEMTTLVDVSEMRFSANYGRLPWPVAVSGGRFSFDGRSVGVSDLAGSLGRSTFSGVAARMRLGRQALLERASGSIVVSLEDFLEGARSIPSAASLVQSVRRLGGSLHVDLQRLAGPLAHLDEAAVAASGTFEEILFDSSSSLSLPPLSISSGRFVMNDDEIRVTDVDARTLDASLRVSGTWSGYREGEGTVEAAADGELGPESIRWGWERASLPAGFRPASPIAVRGVHVSLAGGGGLSLAGDFVVANGPRVTLDLAGDGKKIEVRDLTIVDGETRAFLALARPGGAVDARFRGTLDLGTIERIFVNRPLRRGRIDGDVHVLVPAERPVRPTAEGALAARDVEVPTPAGNVTVERLDARAAGNRVDVSSSSFVLDDQRFTVAGSATLGEKAVALDLDVGTGDLAWTRVEAVLGRLEEAKKKVPAAVAAAESKAVEASPKTAAPASIAIGGDLRVSLGSFAYGDLVWKPVLADVRFGNGAFTAAVRKAEICGISTTGEARALPGGAMAVDIRADAAGPDINLPFTCLGLENVRMTGSYEASAEVRGEGAVSDLPRAVRGPLTFKSAKGRIGKATLLTRILGVVNATDVFAGKDKTHMGDAMPYDRISIDGELADGKVSIREATFVAPSITMAATGTVDLTDRSLDLMVLSHPLSTLDKVVQAVPVVRTVLGRDFLSVAVKVTGSIGDPKARVTPARDVGKGLIGILERTVTLPVKVFDPPSQARQ